MKTLFFLGQIESKKPVSHPPQESDAVNDDVDLVPEAALSYQL